MESTTILVPRNPILAAQALAISINGAVVKVKAGSFVGYPIVVTPGATEEDDSIKAGTSYSLAEDFIYTVVQEEVSMLLVGSLAYNDSTHTVFVNVSKIKDGDGGFSGGTPVPANCRILELIFDIKVPATGTSLDQGKFSIVRRKP